MTSVASLSNSGHFPVMAHEVVENLALNPDGYYVDATYGRGGHSGLLLDALGEEARLVAIDRDPDAVTNALERFSDEPRFSIVKSNFSELKTVLTQLDWVGNVDGMLLDLGVSSPQLDTAERGFGFSQDGRLDMRMDPSTGESAADWLAHVQEEELSRVLKEYGEERYAKRIAKAIIEARSNQDLSTTSQLAEVIKRAHPKWERHHHPATRSFQAIRIHINQELEAIKTVLATAASVLGLGGRLAVISFHSLEDRLVKRAFRKPVPDASIPRHLPQPELDRHPWRMIGKAIRASKAELDLNPRSRSAVLRIAERVL